MSQKVNLLQMLAVGHLHVRLSFIHVKISQQAILFGYFPAASCTRNTARETPKFHLCLYPIFFLLVISRVSGVAA